MQNNVRKLKRAIIREEYVAITGDMVEAVMLNQFIYWTERMWEFDKLILDEAARCEAHAIEQDQTDLTNGWIWKKAVELGEEICSTDSEATINRKLNKLVEKGFLERRRSPKYKWDKTYQYRVDIKNIIIALHSEGYVFADYKYDINSFVATENQNDLSKPQIEGSETQNEIVQTQNESVQNHFESFQTQNEGAIPEITDRDYPNEITSIEITPTEVVIDEGKINELMDLTCYEFDSNTCKDIFINHNGNMENILFWYNQMNNNNSIRNRAAYLRESYRFTKPTPKKQKIDNFNNFEQREFDNSIEEKLLERNKLENGFDIRKQLDEIRGAR